MLKLFMYCMYVIVTFSRKIYKMFSQLTKEKEYFISIS